MSASVPFAPATQARPPGQWGSALRYLARDPVAMVCLAVIGLLLLIAVCAPLLAPHDPLLQDMLHASQDPNAQHWFGTDQFGRDICARIIYGARVSLLVGMLTPLLAGAIGTAVGLVAGYLGGRVDRIVVRIVDLMMAFPSLLLGIMIAAAMGPGLHNLIVALTVAFVPRFIRLARASAATIAREPYVEASVAVGLGHIAIMWRHVLPGILSPVLVMGSLLVATSIRLEATLSFLGLGTQPPSPSWGNIIRDGMNNLLGSPWPIIASGVAITIAVLAFNLLGDSLRDALDPQRPQR